MTPKLTQGLTRPSAVQARQERHLRSYDLQRGHLSEEECTRDLTHALAMAQVAEEEWARRMHWFEAWADRFLGWNDRRSGDASNGSFTLWREDEFYALVAELRSFLENPERRMAR